MQLKRQTSSTPKISIETIKAVATLGAIWVFVTSALAIPISYYRSWILGQIGENGETVGAYALAMIIYQIITTFVLFGGSSILTNYLPKIEQPNLKSSFLLSYLRVSLIAVLFFELIIFLWPEAVQFLARRQMNSVILTALAVLTPLVVLSQIVVYSLAGLMNFRLSSVLTQTHTFVISIFGTIAFILFPEFLANNAILIITAILCLTCIIIILLGTRNIFSALGKPTLKNYLPKGFWKFSSFVHINTICTFAFLYSDQIFVAAVFGIKGLGAYYVILQAAQMIRFVPEQIGQVMLASFSRLVGAGEHEQLKNAYIRLCRLVLVFCTILAIGLILFSKQVGMLFGSWFAEKHFLLVLLAAAVNFGSLGNINSMLIMAKERTGLFLLNNIALILVQITVMAGTISSYGVLGIVSGKVAGIVFGQIGLFAIVRFGIPHINLLPPLEFWGSQITVLGSAVIAYYFNGNSPFVVAIIGLGLIGSFLLTIKFRYSEIAGLIQKT